MAELKQSIGSWWRFSRYEIKDGWIRPAPRARLERYSPLTTQLRTDGPQLRDGPQPAYAMLRDLAPRMTGAPDERGRFQLTAEGKAAVLAWCNTFGLLGLLHDLTETVALASRRIKWKGAWTPAVAVFHRVSTGWQLRMFTPAGELAEFPMALFERYRDGELTNASMPPLEPAHVVRHRGWRDPMLMVEPIGRFWADFFPSVLPADRENYAYPIPHSPEFWKAYAEPVDTFVLAANRFYEAVTLFQAAIDPPLHWEPQRAELKEPRAYQLIESLLSPVRRTVGVVSGKRRELWVFASLLSAMTSMYCEDWASVKPRLCQECGKLFTSTQPSALYCSPRCTNTATKRTYRRRRQQREKGH